MKNSLKATFLTLIAVTAYAVSWAQGTTVLRGTVIDATDNSPLIGATILIEGSSHGAITDDKGAFSLSGLKRGFVNKIEISYLGYKTVSLEYTPSKAVNSYGSPIGMTPESINAGEVVVKGRAPIAKQMGDTVQYNADAFKVNPDATAADLISKMPGMKVENGSPSQGGEAITRITVDGKNYFRDDPATALSSLPADVVENIQVFDELSDDAKFSGVDDGERVKTINIVTKAKRNNAFFGDYIVGYGTDNHYNVKANTNMFFGDHRLTVGFGLNDINQSATSGGRFYGGWGRSGLQKAAGVKLNYSGEFTSKAGRKTSANIDYVFNNQRNTNATSLYRDYDATSAYLSRYYTENSMNKTKSFSHSLRANIESRVSDNDRIIFRPNFSYNTSDGLQFSEMTNIQDGVTTNTATTETGSDSKSFRVGANFNWMHNFSSKHILSTSANFNVSHNDKTQTIHGTNGFFRKAEWIDSLIRQNSVNNEIDNSVGGRLSYTFKINDKSSLMANYRISYTWNDADKLTYVFDHDKDAYELESSLSNVFTRNYLNNTGGIGYNYRIKDKITVNLSADFQNSSLRNDYTYPMQNIYDYTFNSVLANARMDYYFSKSKRMSLSFRGRPGLPSMTQLQDVVDNSNPLRVSVGNPNLDQSYSNDLSFSYMSTNIEKSTNIFLIAFFSNTMNGFANDTRILETDEVINGVTVQQGAELTSPVNINGKWNFNTFFNWSGSLPRIKSNINTGVGYSASRTPSLYNGLKNYSMNNTGRFSIDLTSNISQNIDFTVMSETGVTYSNSTGERDANNRTYINERAGVRLNWIFWKGFFVNADYSYNFNWYSTGGNVDNNYNLLNAGIGKKFLKKQNAEVRISGFDLLNQAKSLSYSVNDTYTQRSISSVLKRYVMFSFSYKFNTMSGKGGSGQRPDYDRAMRPAGGAPMGPPPGGMRVYSR